MSTLDSQQKKPLRSIGHKLNPVVTVSDNGLSEGVMAELERALEDHELIKVKLNVGDPAARKAVAADICEQTGAALAQSIGKVALLYRAAKKPNPKLSNLLRVIG